MIKYALRCDAAHAFESWFRDSDSFDSLSESRLVACPQCGSVEVTKALMAPSVQTSRARAVATMAGSLQAGSPPAAPATAIPSSLPLMDETMLQLRSAVREMREHLLAASTDVGESFPAEARKIHDGLVDPKAIHGIASRDEVRSLLEDGIDILPIPRFPDDSN